MTHQHEATVRVVSEIRGLARRLQIDAIQVVDQSARQVPVAEDAGLIQIRRVCDARRAARRHRRGSSGRRRSRRHGRGRGHRAGRTLAQLDSRPRPYGRSGFPLCRTCMWPRSRLRSIGDAQPFALGIVRNLHVLPLVLHRAGRPPGFVQRHEPAERVVLEGRDLPIVVRGLDHPAGEVALVSQRRRTAGGDVVHPIRLVVLRDDPAAGRIGQRDQIAGGVVREQRDSRTGVELRERLQALARIVAVFAAGTDRIDQRDALARVIPVVGHGRAERVGHRGEPSGRRIIGSTAVFRRSDPRPAAARHADRSTDWVVLPIASVADTTAPRSSYVRVAV